MAAQALPIAAAPRPEALPCDQLAWPQPAYAAPGPLVCAAWADAILAYWQQLRRAGALAPDAPLYLCDLAPGDGVLAWRLLAMLSAGLEGSGVAWPPIRYLVPGAQALLVHPSLAGYAASGLLTADTPALAGHPVVVLAWGHFSTLPAELHAVHYGAVLSAQVSCAPLEYSWTPAQTDAGGLRAALLAHYAGRCNSNCLTLPIAACEAFASVAGERYLLLAADFGISNEQQLRLNACAPPQSWPPATPLPFNAHAFALALQLQGGASWLHQLQDNGHVLYLAWRDAALTPDAATLALMQQTLARAHPDDAIQLAALAAGWTPAQAQVLAPALLRQAGHDAALLRACLPALLQAEPPPDAARNWLPVIDQAWQRYIPPLSYDPFYRQMAAWCVRLGYLGMARHCLQAGLSWYGSDADDLQQLAWCELQTGRRASAMALLADAPDSAFKSALRAGPPPLHSDAMAGLTLERLQPGHAAALLYQYRDPQIAVMTCLPRLDTLEQMHDWISGLNAEPDKLCCVVMHACWGAVGMVCLHTAAAAAYFHFWTGCDFQGRGYGRAGATLLWHCAAQLGVRTIYTSVYRDNLRSRRVLQALGFTALPLRATAPDQDLQFLGKPLAGEAASPQQLRALCEAIGSPFQFHSSTSSTTHSKDESP